MRLKQQTPWPQRLFNEGGRLAALWSEWQVNEA